MKLNLGCGDNYLEGYINIDCNRKVKADYYLNLETDKLPFEDNKVDYILIKHVLEHIENITHLLNECHRVLKPSGIVEIEVPNVANPEGIRNAFGDIFHVRHFSPLSFLMLTGKRELENYRFSNLKKWIIIKLTANKDIHVKMRPRK